jgi:hypothetical protein
MKNSNEVSEKYFADLEATYFNVEKNKKIQYDLQKKKKEAAWKTKLLKTCGVRVAFIILTALMKRHFSRNSNKQDNPVTIFFVPILNTEFYRQYFVLASKNCFSKIKYT